MEGWGILGQYSGRYHVLEIKFNKEKTSNCSQGPDISWFVSSDENFNMPDTAASLYCGHEEAILSVADTVLETSSSGSDHSVTHAHYEGGYKNIEENTHCAKQEFAQSRYGVCHKGCLTKLERWFRCVISAGSPPAVRSQCCKRPALPARSGSVQNHDRRAESAHNMSFQQRPRDWHPFEEESAHWT